MNHEGLVDYTEATEQLANIVKQVTIHVLIAKEK